MSVKVTGQRQLTARLEAVQDVPPVMLRRIALAAVRNQKKLVPRKTGNLGRSIHLGHVSRNSAETEASANYAAAVEYGTKAHKITAKKGKALRFANSGAGVTLGGRVRTGSVRKMGKGAYVFRRSVMHPGTKAQPFMLPGARVAIKGAGAEDIIKAWNGAA